MKTVDLEDIVEFNALSYTWGNPNTIYERPDDGPSVVEQIRAKFARIKQESQGKTTKKPYVQYNLAAAEYREEHPFIPYENVEWDAERDVPIECNGEELLITRNLHAFLRFLQHREIDDPLWNCTRGEEKMENSRRRPIWIDAISIDQTNLKERQSQVCLMDQIFRFAVIVVGWLGPEQMLSSVAFQGIRIICDRSLDPAFEGRLQERSWLQLFKEYGIKHRVWLAIFSLLQRRWFRRIWIVQEAVLAATLLLVCGNDELPWCGFEQAMKFLIKHDLNNELSALGTEILSGGTIPSRKWMVPIVGMYEPGYAPNAAWKGQLDINPQESYAFVSGVAEFRRYLGHSTLDLSLTQEGEFRLFDPLLHEQRHSNMNF
jgi:hypothetical protein